MVIEELIQEMERAEVRFGPFTSSHEGYGVLIEEIKELLDAIQQNTFKGVRKEALQVSAVALRMVKACDESQSFFERSGFYGKDI